MCSARHNMQERRATQVTSGTVLKQEAQAEPSTPS